MNLVSQLVPDMDHELKFNYWRLSVRRESPQHHSDIYLASHSQNDYQTDN